MKMVNLPKKKVCKFILILGIGSIYCHKPTFLQKIPCEAKNFYVSREFCLDVNLNGLCQNEGDILVKPNKTFVRFKEDFSTQEGQWERESHTLVFYPRCPNSCCQDLPHIESFRLLWQDSQFFLEENSQLRQVQCYLSW
ncbi:MAG: hypothetical protein NZM25_08225 [Leptospiraceae bacterium]|nr:hypothetical protein [Leptospiraceae bacterium]MDW8307033.1 hypothetical protein [Leptospiraceae bacterium]